MDGEPAPIEQSKAEGESCTSPKASARLFRSDLLIIAVIAVYWAGCSLLWFYTGLSNITLQSVLTNAILIVAGVTLALLAVALMALARHRPDRPIGFLAALWRRENLGARLGQALPLLAALAIFMPVFSAMKRAVGFYTDFPWDGRLTALDASIHGGDAWRLLSPLISVPPLMSAITFFYHAWLTLLYVGLPLICLDHRRPELRRRFILSSVLGWIVIGNGLATLFASVGPCFLLPIHGDAHFVPLMNALQEANRHFPVLTLDVQQRLMEMQHAKRNLLGAGISAMPSVHVHFALLFALWGMKVSKRAGAAFAAFFIVICIGSVATGYHYAVDGYLAIAITLIIWWATGRLFREAPKAI